MDIENDDLDLNDAAALIGGLDLDGEEEHVEQAEDESESDELDLSDDADEQEGDEPEKGEESDEPAIDAPASLNKAEKQAFANATPAVQRAWAEAETRRNSQVQEATTKASEAQREAQAAAARADAHAKANYAKQLEAIANQFAPQRPDPRLAQHDPSAYIAQQAQYEALAAQHGEFMQQIQGLGQEAEQGLSETDIATRNRELMSFPEVQNEATRAAFFEMAESAAKRIGLDIEEVATHASATELKRLHDIAQAFEKADKYDAAMSKQMQRVREGKKQKSAKPNAVQSNGRQRGFRDARDKARQSGSLEDAAAAIARLG